MKQWYSEDKMHLWGTETTDPRANCLDLPGNRSDDNWQTAAVLAGEIETLRAAYRLLPSPNGLGSSPWEIDIPVQISRLSHLLVGLVGNLNGGHNKRLRRFRTAFSERQLETVVDMAADERNGRLIFLNTEGTVLSADFHGRILEIINNPIDRPRGVFVDEEGSVGVYNEREIIFANMPLEIRQLVDDRADGCKVYQVAADKRALWLLLDEPPSRKRLLELPRRGKSVRVREVNGLPSMPLTLFRAGRRVLVCDRLGYVFQLEPEESLPVLLCRSAPSPVVCGCGTPTGFILVSSHKLCMVAGGLPVAAFDLCKETDVVNFAPRSVGMVPFGDVRDGRGNMLVVLDPFQSAGQGRLQGFVMYG